MAGSFCRAAQRVLSTQASTGALSESGDASVNVRLRDLGFNYSNIEHGTGPRRPPPRIARGGSGEIDHRRDHLRALEEGRAVTWEDAIEFAWAKVPWRIVVVPTARLVVFSGDVQRLVRRDENPCIGCRIACHTGFVLSPNIP